MFTEFKHTLLRMRGAIIGWGLGLFLYDIMMSSFFSIIEEMGADFTALLDSYPQEMLAFFPSINEFTNPVGYIDTYFFSMMTLIIGVLAISACAKLLVGDEEQGILDLVMSYPVSRSSLFWGRVLGYMAALMVILITGWLGWVIPAESAGLELTWIEFLRPFLPLFALLFLFGMLTLLFSMLLPSGRIAGALSGGLLVGNFLLIGLSNLNPDLESIYKLTPFYFNQGGAAAEGINWGWLAGLLVTSLVLASIAWWRFQVRDIRVGGEGGWKLPLPGFLKRSGAET